MSTPIENYVVYKAGESYIVKGSFSGEEWRSSSSASEAIQYAINLLGSSGGEVTIGRGDFELSAAITLTSNVVIRGGGRSSRLLVGRANTAGVGIECDGIDGAVITDIAVIPSDNVEGKVGMVLNNCGNCEIRNVFCGGFSEYGIWVRENSFLCTVFNCSLAGNGKTNIYLDNLGEGRCGNYLPNLITGCTIYGGGKGIECKRAIVVNIVGCVVFQTMDIAYHIHSFSNSVVISGSRTFQITGQAVVVEESHELNVSSNIFCWHTGSGIVVKNSSWGTISANEIIDSGSYNSGAENHSTMKTEVDKDVVLFNGVELLGSRGYTISANTVFNWGVVPKLKIGIYEDAECCKNIIANNNVNYYEESDVVSLGKESIVSDNIGCDREAYESHGKPYYQSFVVEATQRFIEKQKMTSDR